MKKKTYALLERPKQGYGSHFKTAHWTKIKECTDLEYVVKWIQDHGNKENVYFIQGMDSNFNEKWAYDAKRQWHTTRFRMKGDPASKPRHLCCGHFG